MRSAFLRTALIAAALGTAAATQIGYTAASFAGQTDDRHIVIPAEYIIKEQLPDLVSGQLQIAALTQGRFTPNRVTWEFRVVKRGGRWQVYYWRDVSRG